MVYISDTTEKQFCTKMQNKLMYQHFLEYEYPAAWNVVQTAIQNRDEIPKFYHSKRRFLQIIQQTNLSIKIPKKEYCDTCKAYSAKISRCTDPKEKEKLMKEKEEHQLDAHDTRECFSNFKSIIRRSHGLE